MGRIHSRDAGRRVCGFRGGTKRSRMIKSLPWESPAFICDKTATAFVLVSWAHRPEVNDAHPPRGDSHGQLDGQPHRFRSSGDGQSSFI
ncbi:uncharacterized protein EI90DRAFT_2568447 [Cantharellus anzutake]|uniref:uncharacterized protein n=1 Tax=Cantharellus anzutake TaxID=1750568 RepID=UPI0019078465|nr:uncharacterized protein EI90DRAFT_2568447 [Cantharellus anzutake]KAF8338273.1 hypothetical protein EI90DRAFT_2568447 [Cantharellus anzutake]